MRLRRSSSGLRTSESTQDFCAGQSCSPAECAVCKVGLRLRHRQIAGRIIANKYSASQNFFYSKDIADLLDNRSTRNVLLTGDLRLLDSTEENLGSLNSAGQSHQLISELAEYFKYYRDVPRLHMRSFVQIYRRHHELKRILEYNRLKIVLNLSSEQHQQSLPSRQRPTVKPSLILKDIQLSREVTERPSSQSSSLLQLKERLAKVIRDEPRKQYRNSTLELIDKLYTFPQKGIARAEKPINKCSFQDISEIQYGGSRRKLAVPTTTLPSPNMKKNNRTKVGVGACHPFLLRTGKSVHDRKRMSMENMRSTCLISERSRELRNRRTSQEGKRQVTQLPRSKSPLIVDKLKLEKKSKNKRGILASTDTSYERPRTNIQQTPLPVSKPAGRKYVTPTSSGKPKHARVSSEQLDAHRRSLNDLPTAKSPKLKITINQNNIFNIVLDGRKDLPKTPNRPLKKQRK